MRRSLPALVLLLCLAAPARAAFLRDLHLPDRQPDGTVVDLFVTGDEHHRLVRDARGYTVVKDPRTGWRVYADLRDGRLVPTPFVAGLDDPAAAGLRPGLQAPPPPDAPLRPVLRRPAPPARKVAGTATNLLIFLRFQDDPQPAEPFEGYRKAFVSEDPADPSLLRYFREVSRGALDVRTVFLPPPEGAVVAFHTIPHPRGWCRDYDPVGNPDGYRDQDEAAAREQAMLTDVLVAIGEDLPPGTVLDGDGDGWVDNAIFMVQGQPDQWADLLWPHAWSLFVGVPVGDATVQTFNLEFTTLLEDAPGTFAHEMYHSLGAPDLYHYSYDGQTPVGPWDVMEHTASPPQHPLAYMKWRYGGWIDEIPLVQGNREVVLHDSWDAGPQAVRVAVPESSRQFFVLEYRRARGSFESGLPGTGLLVYRVDLAAEGDGNRQGPPDEVRVMRPPSDLYPDGDLPGAFLSAEAGRTLMNQRSPLKAVVDGGLATLRVYDVGYPGDTLSFKVCLQPPADCGGRQCDDGCGGWCGDCPNGSHCVEGQCRDCTCDGLACGPDGCGGDCGGCPGDPCALQRCEYGRCVTIFQGEDGAACQDGDPCTKDDACRGQACLGTAYACDPGPCDVSAACDGLGGCTRVRRDAGASCTDGDPCTRDDRCDAAGQCAGQAFTCTPGPCEAASVCDSRGGCYATPLPAGQACDDGDPATGDDRCDGKGRCRGTAAPPVPDTSEEVGKDGKSGGCSASSRGPAGALLPWLLLAAALALRPRRRTA